MLCIDNTTIYQEIQGFTFRASEFNPLTCTQISSYVSNANVSDVICPFCGAKVHVKDHYTTTLKDMPFWFGEKHVIELKHNRYICTDCRLTFTEQLSVQQSETRITQRAAVWIKGLLRHNMTIFSVVRITGIHWDTVRRIHQKYMQDCLDKTEQDWNKTGYKPKYLAVDEFALHKGHEYATSVMDLETGYVIWVGKGRAMKDFIHFFEETDKDFLSDVQAVAMDMNASYNTLVQQYLPNADIVYDRYHMQADFGRTVLGMVRLREAREHKAKAVELKALQHQETDPEKRVFLKDRIRAETNLYSTVKKSRWLILTNSAQLNSNAQEILQNILCNHTDISVCYAMKEEMRRLYNITDVREAETGWKGWFAAAKSSGIPELQRFAVNKEKRLAGLVAHARHFITTAKLEGLNNKIKVAKRVAYGYRNEVYFFTLVKFISIPSPEIP